ncbi:hypothetical protein [Reyranella sp.]|uniref:hypothetical protein n=1 Tax=Reyranella sp. TaxID=1929291 RepID=UPI0037835EEC
MRDFDWPQYVTVAEQRRRAMKELARLRKGKRPVAPVTIEGNAIARSFWGKAWCANLERYSDYATRLPRGRSYVRNGMVVDLQIADGKISALVSGTELYTTTIAIAPVPAARWKAICRDCTGSIDSLVELLQGRLARSVMDRVCRQGDGLFPAPKEIKLACSCEDSARMCKHVAAALYGVGTRLDEKPELLFALRHVDESELISGAEQAPSSPSPVPASDNVLAEGDVGALFGLEMAEGAATPVAARAERKRKKPSEAPAKLAGRSRTKRKAQS